MDVSEFRDGLPTPAISDARAVLRFPLNEHGRDFVVGDIHGMFKHLIKLLADAGFDGETDRLFSVGDLVDRGPDSNRALEWLDEPWFHACRGNHEQFAIDSADPEQLDVWVNYNGGEWWMALGVEEQEVFRTRFKELPMALEVETRWGRVGIVHADVPPLLPWERFMDLLEARDRDAALYAMWSRNRISGMCTSLPVTGGVQRVYCGHTPTRETVQIDNVYYIDTGAAYSFDGYEEARLTMVEIQPDRHREYCISTHE
jgi:serine/threonine protein phosphatase 1